MSVRNQIKKSKSLSEALQNVLDFYKGNKIPNTRELIESIQRFSKEEDSSDGVSIASIALISTVGLEKTYRITFTDASTFDYVVADGEDGQDGADGNGIQSIALLSTVGLEKTYRITFTDNTTFDYVVTDGEDGGLEGTNYIFVAADGTDVENALSLQAAYDEAKTMSPSATNRITIVAANGYYNFGTSAFVMDTQFIDLVSLDGNRSIIFNSADANGTISITQNFIYVKGVDVLTKNFLIGSGFSSLRIENCKGGDFSFGGDPTFGSNPVTVSGTFTDCQGGIISFGAYGVALGTFINCKAGSQSFGFQATASGTFTNCEGAQGSFGGFGGTASGVFTNCISGNASFGGGNANSVASGTFNNCIGGNVSFGGNGGTLSGKLYRCRLTAGTFETPTGAGKIVLGIDGNDDVINL